MRKKVAPPAVQAKVLLFELIQFVIMLCAIVTLAILL